MRLNSLFDPGSDPHTNRFRLLLRVIEGLDRRSRTVEHRDRAAPVFRVAIDIGQSGRQ
jgi:hypothetical protein